MWWKIPIRATVVITLRAKGKNSLKEGESGKQKAGKDKAETRSNGNQRIYKDWIESEAGTKMRNQ